MTALANDWREPRRLFLLAPDEIYLNAGTFSALPRVVYEELVALIASAEANPTREAAWRGRAPLWEAQQQIARYLGAEANEILFHKNVTQALNQALFSLRWREGGEFLASNQEYGAIVNAARETCRRRGLRFREFALPRKPRSSEELFDAVIGALSSESVGVLLSHITSATGIVSPVERMATELRRRNVRFIVDGAHGPGLVPLRLSATDIDVYGGNLHKWFMGPKGTGFLFVARRLHEVMQPHIVGWGGTPHDSKPIHDRYGGNDSRFQHVFRIQGLIDYSPFLALPATLRFRESLGEERILARIAELVRYARGRLDDMGLKCLSPVPEVNAGLLAYEPPPAWHRDDAGEVLFRQHRITIPIWRRRSGGFLMRISPHICNSEEDVDRLVEALRRG